MKHIEESFKELVELKYQIFNSLFLTLKFDSIESTGTLLPLLQKHCNTSFQKYSTPKEIIDIFIEKYRPNYTENDKISFLYNVIQYVERQVVLLDAIEEAAFNKIHDLNNQDSWHQVLKKAKRLNKEEELSKFLSEFGVRIVLTAHPTQFYPDRVLNIIKDLRKAINNNDIAQIKDLLTQLGKTPFLNKEKPSPYDEAMSLMNYLTQIFYPAISELTDKIAKDYKNSINLNNKLFQIGFWPGGDRDGNPFVNVNTTLSIAKKLKNNIIELYLKDIKKLKRRLTFSGVFEKIELIENKLNNELENKNKYSLSEFKNDLKSIEELLTNQHDGLFIDLLYSFENKVNIFGYYLASIDIRQDSRVIRNALEQLMSKYPDLLPENLFNLDPKEQLDILLSAKGNVSSEGIDDAIVCDTIDSFKAIKEIQNQNGEHACHRYIISNCQSEIDVAVVYCLFNLCGWGDIELSVDIVPLFETIEDLKNAQTSMDRLYSHPTYKAHLEKRENNQTVMLGFSDGTKDGGYLRANWSIFTAKEEITQLSLKYGIDVIFFDGRGGPPARGGGKAHLFYAALGKTISNKQIQITIQGQTINTQFGTKESAIYNLESLLTAGIKNNVFESKENVLSQENRVLIEELASKGYEAYKSLKNDPLFMPYLNEKSTLKYFGKANIGSRPSKRGSSKDLRFEDLRAIPFVGAWSQLKQNVPGYFGVGSALNDKDKFSEYEKLYNESSFFKALMSNSMQSMSKTYFPLSSYLKNDEKFGKYWEKIYEEFKLSKEMILKVSNQKELLEDEPRSLMSIRLREEIVLPLLTIQQYALIKINELQKNDKIDDELLYKYEKMVIRSLFGNINASRNSA